LGKHIFWVHERELAGRAGPEKLPWNVQELVNEGIGAVVSLAGPVDSIALRRAGVEHLHLPVPMVLLDSERAQRRFLEVMPLVLDFVQRAIQSHKPVLIHCYHGCDRTGTALACCLVALHGLTAEQAVAKVRAANPGAMAIAGYADAVETFTNLLSDK
jgi:predicted protein tyrosine phosphatase